MAVTVHMRIDPHQAAGPSLRIAFLGHGPGHGGSLCPGLQKFFPSISRKAETFIINSAGNFFSRLFSSSGCFSASPH